jgi:hypothetical protein
MAENLQNIIEDEAKKQKHFHHFINMKTFEFIFKKFCIFSEFALLYSFIPLITNFYG